MSDIVKVLRGKCALDYDEKTLDQFCNEAADEIEKLRAALRSIAANTCCDRCQEAALVARAALGAERTNGDITVNLSQVARAYKQGAAPWQYVSIYELSELSDMRIECAVLINGDLAEALKIARAALGEKE